MNALRRGLLAAAVALLLAVGVSACQQQPPGDGGENGNGGNGARWNDAVWNEAVWN